MAHDGALELRLRVGSAHSPHLVLHTLLGTRDSTLVRLHANQPLARCQLGDKRTRRHLQLERRRRIVGGAKAQPLIERRRLLQRYQVDRLAGVSLSGRCRRMCESRARRVWEEGGTGQQVAHPPRCGAAPGAL